MLPQARLRRAIGQAKGSVWRVSRLHELSYLPVHGEPAFVCGVVRADARIDPELFMDAPDARVRGSGEELSAPPAWTERSRPSVQRRGPDIALPGGQDASCPPNPRNSTTAPPGRDANRPQGSPEACCVL